MQEIIQTLHSVELTLQQLEIKSTESNLDKLLGCILTLRTVQNKLAENKQEEKKPEKEEWNNV